MIFFFRHALISTKVVDGFSRRMNVRYEMFFLSLCLSSSVSLDRSQARFLSLSFSRINPRCSRSKIFTQSLPAWLFFPSDFCPSKRAALRGKEKIRRIFYTHSHKHLVRVNSDINSTSLLCLTLSRDVRTTCFFLHPSFSSCPRTFSSCRRRRPRWTL